MSLSDDERISNLFEVSRRGFLVSDPLWGEELVLFVRFMFRRQGGFSKASVSYVIHVAYHNLFYLFLEPVRLP